MSPHLTVSVTVTTFKKEDYLMSWLLWASVLSSLNKINNFIQFLPPLIGQNEMSKGDQIVTHLGLRSWARLLSLMQDLTNSCLVTLPSLFTSILWTNRSYSIFTLIFLKISRLETTLSWTCSRDYHQGNIPTWKMSSALFSGVSNWSTNALRNV